jgi:uncharacterized protein YkwD
MYRHLLASATLGLFCTALLAADKEETFPNGKLKAKYSVDGNDRKHGPYVEYGEDGKVKVKATYREGKLDGWRVNYENGKPVASQLFRDDECLIPHGLEETLKTLIEILRAPAATKKADALTLEREAALRQLKAYRYLCGVPYDNLELDADMTKYAQAAAQLLDKVGRLDHHPANPGLPKEEYEIGLKGTSNSNLNILRTLPNTVIAWIDDSDAPNIERLGHRRWCLNPALQQTGFGKSSKFTAMWSMDASQKDVPDYDFVAFPPRGYVPANLFQTGCAWSISLNPKKYKAPDSNVKVKLYSADKNFKQTGKPLELALFKINAEGFGIPNCIIFLPKEKTGPGQRYWVEVEGVKDVDDKPVTMHYVTEIVKLK